MIDPEPENEPKEIDVDQPKVRDPEPENKRTD